MPCNARPKEEGRTIRAAGTGVSVHPPDGRMLIRAGVYNGQQTYHGSTSGGRFRGRLDKSSCCWCQTRFACAVSSTSL